MEAVSRSIVGYQAHLHIVLRHLNYYNSIFTNPVRPKMVEVLLYQHHLKNWLVITFTVSMQL
jgi:hypothetical protein